MPHAESLRFDRDDWGRLLLSSPDVAEPTLVEPVRCFPLTHPRGQIALLDPEGRELVRLKSVDDLPMPAREILERELIEREFAPVILRILRTTASSLPGSWDVETDRGATRFDLDSEDDIRRLPDGTVILADSNGIRYRIPSVGQLDAGSRAILRQFL